MTANGTSDSFLHNGQNMVNYDVFKFESNGRSLNMVKVSETSQFDSRTMCRKFFVV